jgi:hypothetical protein
MKHFAISLLLLLTFYKSPAQTLPKTEISYMKNLINQEMVSSFIYTQNNLVKININNPIIVNCTFQAPYANLSILSFETDKYNNSRNMFKKSLFIDPNNSLAYKYLGFLEFNALKRKNAPLYIRQIFFFISVKF